MNTKTHLIPNSDPWQALSRVISRLLTQYPFYGHVLTQLARKMDPSLPYAAGVAIGSKSLLAINPELFFKETLKHQTGILMHEIEHVVRLHIPRFREKIKGNPALKQKANMAMDMAINCTLSSDLLPEWVIRPQEFHLPDYQSAEWYYTKLPDPYSLTLLSITGRLLRDDFNSGDGSTDENPEIPPELTHQIIREILENACEETKRTRDHIPSHVHEILEKMKEPPKVAWNLLLRRLCQWASLREKAYTKKRRSRRYGTRPGPYMKRKLSLTVAMDTSASISTEDLSWFFSELDHISKTGAEIALIQCDAQVQKVEKYTHTFNKESPQVYGRGGTAFQPVFDYLLEERTRIPDLLVFFTDGYGDNPEDPVLFPVCWVYTPNHRKAADFGFHINYEP